MSSKVSVVGKQIGTGPLTWRQKLVRALEFGFMIAVQKMKATRMTAIATVKFGQLPNKPATLVAIGQIPKSLCGQRAPRAQQPGGLEIGVTCELILKG